ncbi:potassium transporter 10-like [Cucumis melo var. makuwa]|uniref:Potassium transporter 10-like n=1 Tax=Cucumis melo var. makuwa TaxID=1194695 RepID=A0A5A7V247_CUCMM|nr:potassium transporter 10-like [Cucumis melo var. makuwa]TYK24770.1 potassium transporter 10-like [Cucumis melo var. makuwa]
MSYQVFHLFFFSDLFVDASQNLVNALLKLGEDRVIIAFESGLMSLVGILPNRVIQPIAEHSDYPVERIGATVVVLVADVILVGWFSLQRYGTDRVGWLFALVVLWFLLIGDHSVTEVDQPNPSSRRRPDESFTATPTLDRPFFHRRAIDHSSVGLPSPLYVVKCVVDLEVLLKCVVDKKVLLKYVVDYEVLLKCFVDHEVLLKCCVVRHEVNVMCLFG